MSAPPGAKLRCSAKPRRATTGASGSGKTLLLELLGLLRRPAPEGRYLLIDGAATLDLAPLWPAADGRACLARARGLHFGFVPQTGGLMPFLSVRENVLLTQRISRRRDPDHAEALLARLGLAGIAGLRPDQLSIGPRLRVSSAGARPHRPRFVIADEPTAALDPETAQEAMALLIGAADLSGAAVVISSHDRALLGRFPLSRHHLRVLQRAYILSYRSALETLVSEIDPEILEAAFRLLQDELELSGQDSILANLLAFNSDLSQFAARPDMPDDDLLVMALAR